MGPIGHPVTANEYRLLAEWPACEPMSIGYACKAFLHPFHTFTTPEPQHDTARDRTLHLGNKRSTRTLSRQRVGCPVPRRSSSVRDARARGRASRLVVVHYSEQARRLSPRVQELRYRYGRPLHAEADR